MGLAIISAVAIIIAGFVLLNFLIPESDSVRTILDCSNAGGISDGVKIFCLMVNISIPYYIWIIFALAVGGILARVALG